MTSAQLDLPSALRAPTNGGAYRQRLMLIREPAPELRALGELLRGPEDAYRIMQRDYADSPQEVFVAFYLNTKHRICEVREMTRGTLDMCLITPRDVFGPALLCCAAGVIIAHNHPSGDPSPSAEDRLVTRQLGDAGRTLCIPLMDHIVCGFGAYSSLADECADRLAGVGGRR